MIAVEILVFMRLGWGLFYKQEVSKALESWYESSQSILSSAAYPWLISMIKIGRVLLTS
jgi:hypothetical protein